MLIYWVLSIACLFLACLPPHYLFQIGYSYLLGFKEKEFSRQSSDIRTYSAVKPYFWFATHLFLCLQTLVFLKSVSNLFYGDFFLGIGMVLLYTLFLFVACAFSFRFSYLFTLIFATVIFFTGIYSIPFVILTLICFLMIPNLEILVYVSLLFQFALMLIYVDSLVAILGTVLLLFLTLIKHYFLAKNTQMDWTKRLFQS